MLKKAVTVKMRADVPLNLCTNKLKARNDLGGSPPHPHDMANNKTSSGVMDSSRHHSSVRIYIPLLATLLSKLSRVSPCQVSISSNHNIQLKPCSCRGVAELWQFTRLNAHQSESLTSVPTGVQSGSDLLQNAFHKTSSV